ncbi:MAG: hypothetical protein OHK0046_10550 [Anaerolineae bacterium]
MTDELEPISAEQARTILYDAIQTRLGAHWNHPQEGWAIITSHDYMARLNKGRRNIDFYVDLLGNVTIEEKEINPAQENGRLIVLMFLFGSLFIAFILARIAGYL